ncbi:MAG TPA: amidohydrolase, partial [Pseudonocardia sp.]|nr:amidohydrolase [Pseudonocardia sp.]
MPGSGLAGFVGALPLVDHHCHGVASAELDGAAFEALLGEGGAPPPGLSRFDTPVGLAVRRWCAPVLDLHPHSPAREYLDRRRELGGAEVTARLLRATGTREYLLDTGYRGEELLDPARFATTAA